MIDITFCLGIFENVSLQSCKYFVDEFEAGSKLIGRWRRIVQNCFRLSKATTQSQVLKHSGIVACASITQSVFMGPIRFIYEQGCCFKLYNLEIQWTPTNRTKKQFGKHIIWQPSPENTIIIIFNVFWKCCIIPSRILWLTLWRLQRQRNQWKCPLIGVTMVHSRESILLGPFPNASL